MLAPFDGMILVGQSEFDPEGTTLTTLWEWQSGIPLPTGITGTLEEPALMNTTTTDDDATGDTNNATEAAATIEQEEEQQEREQETTLLQ